MIVGFLAPLGIEVRPANEAEVPALLDWLYGDGGTFASCVFFVVGALVASIGAFLIKWSFTGSWLRD